MHCSSGNEIKVSSCAVVQPKQSTEQHLPIAAEEIAACGAAVSAEAVNLALSEAD